MTPLVDIHCHVLPGLDDGPASLDEAIAMCRIAWHDGTRSIAATAHMSEAWPTVTAARIRQATQALIARLRELNLRLNVYPSAEITVRLDLEEAWQRGELLGVGDRPSYLLIEFPHGVFFDLRDMVRRLRAQGVRPILAHAERQEELVHDPGLIEGLIQQGCLVQVNAASIADPAEPATAHVLRHWVRRGVVHLLGSDGHATERRPPIMSAAYARIASWAGHSAADRICSLHGLAVLEGRTLRLPAPDPHPKKWFSFLRP